MLKWIQDNPALATFLFASIIWPLTTAILTAFFSKPSPEFEQRWPRLAALRRIPSDAGVNLPKLLANVGQLITGRIAKAAPVVPIDVSPPTPRNDKPEDLQ